MLRRNCLIKTITTILVLSLTGITTFAGSTYEPIKISPKYVFYLIGDGLGVSQRSLTELYLKELNNDKSLRLRMNTFPIIGLKSTYAANTLVTGSSAAGTAMATGHKTNNGMVGVLPNGNSVKNIIEAAREKGMAGGVISNTRITHATPASFAAHNLSRNNGNEIAEEYLTSGYEFFAGGGYRHFVPQSGEFGKSKRKDDRNIIEEFKKIGYKTFLGEGSSEAFRNYHPAGPEKVMAAFTYSHMPYQIDREQNPTTLSLSEMTAKGIEVLSKYENGFILMVEGGRIDHAAHDNDAPGTITETLEFDKCVELAYQFYLNHPEETLVLVVGDHETGGLGLGMNLDYFLNLEELFDVKASVEDIIADGGIGGSDNDRYKTGHREEYYKVLEDKFGLDNLTLQEKTELEKVMDRFDKKEKFTESEFGYETNAPLAITSAQIVSRRAGIYWTTLAHTATPVPLSAIGVGASNFSGYTDNTGIPQTLAKILKVELTNTEVDKDQGIKGYKLTKTTK